MDVFMSVLFVIAILAFLFFKIIKPFLENRYK